MKIREEVREYPNRLTGAPCGINGDPAVFFRTHRVALVRYAATLTGDWHKAEDLAQEAFARIFDRWEAVDHSRPLYAYVRKILLREFLASTRNESAHRESLMPEIPDRATAEHGPMLDDRTLNAVVELGGRQRQVLYLRYVENMPTREVAELLGISPGTVTSLASRATRRIREKLLHVEPA
ncbi:RNA polymerase sigma factor [Kitasatospora sp. NPDC089509]|uniref:RNA polymerase sigma factor n=1 Tax=Kitasatospora sp. NPDC089509 TaxID=3364079 RepID=UPI0037F7C202